MPISKVKNIVIFILVLVNILLLCLVIPLVQERQAQAAEAYAQLETLMERYGVQLHTETLPTTRTLYTVEFTPRDDGALPAMQALLGEMVLMENDSTRYVQIYRSEQGICQLSRGSDLEARLEGREAASDLPAAAAAELEAMGLDTAYVTTPTRSSAGIYSVTAVQRLLDVPVFTAALRCTFQNGVLSRMEGTLYFDTTDLCRTDDNTCCSAADALVAFLGSRDALGWVGSSVTDVAQGYCRAETASAAVVRLVPGWRISTDTGDFWVNGISRQVSLLQV